MIVVLERMCYSCAGSGAQPFAEVIVADLHNTECNMSQPLVRVGNRGPLLPLRPRHPMFMLRLNLQHSQTRSRQPGELHRATLHRSASTEAEFLLNALFL